MINLQNCTCCEFLRLSWGNRNKKNYHYFQEQICLFPYRSILIWLNRKEALSCILHFSFKNRILIFPPMLRIVFIRWLCYLWEEAERSIPCMYGTNNVYIRVKVRGSKWIRCHAGQQVSHHCMQVTKHKSEGCTLVLKPRVMYFNCCLKNVWNYWRLSQLDNSDNTANIVGSTCI